MKKFIAITAVAAAMSFASVAPIGATPASAAKGGIDRPFKATANGTIALQEFDDCDFSAFPDVVCDQVIETVFIGTHLGKSTNTTEGKVTLHLGVPPCTTPSGNPNGVEYDVATSAVIVAANGDELYATTNVSGCGDGIGLTEPAGTYTITGGTGRFDGATGGGTVSASTIGEAFSNSWTGTITY